MIKSRSDRGFPFVAAKKYIGDDVTPLVTQSSAIGEYSDAFDKPGSSYLWVGPEHHLDRQEVKKLVSHLNNWLEKGEL